MDGLLLRFISVPSRMLFIIANGLDTRRVNGRRTNAQEDMDNKRGLIINEEGCIGAMVVECVRIGVGQNKQEGD